MVSELAEQFRSRVGVRAQAHWALKQRAGWAATRKSASGCEFSLASRVLSGSV